MLKRITRILPFLIVTLLCIAAVEAIYRGFEGVLLKKEQVAATAKKMASERGNSEGVRKHQDYAVIVKRNLFQSYQSTEVAEQAPEGNPLEGLEATTLELVLMGTVSGEESEQRAFIQDKKTKKQEIYYQGDMVQGAEIQEILRGKVILSYQGRNEVLDMTEAAELKTRNSSPPAVSPTPKRRRIVGNQKQSSDVEESLESEESEEEPEEQVEEQEEEDESLEMFDGAKEAPPKPVERRDGDGPGPGGPADE